MKIAPKIPPVHETHDVRAAMVADNHGPPDADSDGQHRQRANEIADKPGPPRRTQLHPEVCVEDLLERNADPGANHQQIERDVEICSRHGTTFSTD